MLGGSSGSWKAPFRFFAYIGDPSKPDYKVRDLEPPESIGFDRVYRRRTMQQALDDFARDVEQSPVTASRDAFYEQAYRLLTSPEAKSAFDLSQEPQKVRERYGGRRVGTSCLLARRVVEAGARFVTVVGNGWDMHQQSFKAMADAFFPRSGKLP